MSIGKNIQIILDKVNEASINSGRDLDSVKVMAVSKFHPIEKVYEAYEEGLKIFGENRVQEAVEKFSTNTLENLELHLIGSLQRNKVKKILPIVNCIQSVDRIELLQEIAKHENSKDVKILLEVHTGEESKKGFMNTLDLENAIKYAISVGLNITGFMTMAPFTDDKKIIRKAFVQLRDTSNKIRDAFPNLQLPELSMGMSNDYEIAIEEGSTLIRVGTAIFGNTA